MGPTHADLTGPLISYWVDEPVDEPVQSVFGAVGAQHLVLSGIYHGIEVAMSYRDPPGAGRHDAGSDHRHGW